MCRVLILLDSFSLSSRAACMPMHVWRLCCVFKRQGRCRPQAPLAAKGPNGTTGGDSACLGDLGMGTPHRTILAGTAPSQIWFHEGPT